MMYKKCINNYEGVLRGVGFPGGMFCGEIQHGSLTRVNFHRESSPSTETANGKNCVFDQTL